VNARRDFALRIRNSVGIILRARRPLEFLHSEDPTRTLRPSKALRLARSNYLNSVSYLAAIWFTCSFVSDFFGIPGGRQVSRKNASRPAGATIQSSSNS
jgi:hypothetical protein